MMDLLLSINFQNKALNDPERFQTTPQPNMLLPQCPRLQPNGAQRLLKRDEDVDGCEGRGRPEWQNPSSSPRSVVPNRPIVCVAAVASLTGLQV